MTIQLDSVIVSSTMGSTFGSNPIDHYKVLGVPRSASLQAIKKAYRHLARRLHPDHNKSANASAQFQVLHESYVVLRDRDRRRAYDRTLLSQASPIKHASTRSRAHYPSDSDRQRTTQGKQAPRHDPEQAIQQFAQHIYAQNARSLSASYQAAWKCSLLTLLFTVDFLHAPLQHENFLAASFSYLGSFVGFTLSLPIINVLDSRLRPYPILRLVLALSLFKMLHTLLIDPQLITFSNTILVISTTVFLSSFASFCVLLPFIEVGIGLARFPLLAFMQLLLAFIVTLPCIMVTQALSFPDSIYRDDDFWYGLFRISVVASVLAGWVTIVGIRWVNSLPFSQDIRR